MLCCRSEEDAEAKLIDKQIEREMRKKKMEEKGIHKLLVLGTGESGKSTFIKQMRIIHGQGYKEEDRRAFAPLMYQNIFKAIQNLVTGMEMQSRQFQNKQFVALASKIKQVDYMSVTKLDKEYADIIKRLWQDPSAQECFHYRNEFQISDSADFFLNSIDRIILDDYIPTLEDILRARAPTTGIQEYLFKVKKGSESSKILLVDVGGQRNERRKWIHCFENVTAILFLVALSEYDQRLWESEHENRLEESRALFQTILSYEFFSQSTFVLFLNKTDLLEEKIKYSHLANYYPDFKGPKASADAARKFILDMFERLPGKKHRFYAHFTCATDTENIRRVFDIVRDSVLLSNLSQYNLM